MKQYWFFFLILSFTSIFANSSVKNSWDPSHYNRYSEPQLLWAMQLLDQYEFKGTEHILDIGCGDGKISDLIAKRVPEGSVTGIDYSNEMISFAQKEYAAIPNLDFLQADAESFTFQDQFDLIVSFNCLHWVRNHQNVLRQIKLHLKEGGSVLLNFSPLQKSHPLFQAIKSCFFDIRWIWYISCLKIKQKMDETSLEEYRKLIEDEGFTSISCERIEQKTIFPNEDAFTEWLLGWLPMTSKMPDRLKRKFAHDITKRYLKITAQKEGDIVTFTHYPWEIIAKR